MDKIWEFLNGVLPKLFERLIDSFSVNRATAYTVLGIVLAGALVISQSLLEATLPDGTDLLKEAQEQVLIWVQRVILLIAYIFRYRAPEAKQ